MDVPPAKSRTFLHRVVRWVAILALTYGGLQAVSLTVLAASQGFPFDRYYYGGRVLSLGMSVLMVVLAAMAIVGGWGLLRWRAWGRLALIAWPLLTILLGLVQGIVSTTVFLRAAAATTQPSGLPGPGSVIWASFGHWLTNCVLPAVFLLILLQPEVARLWPSPRGAGGFDVIPMATATADAPPTAPTEVVQ